MKLGLVAALCCYQVSLGLLAMQKATCTHRGLSRSSAISRGTSGASGEELSPYFFQMYFLSSMVFYLLLYTIL